MRNFADFLQHHKKDLTSGFIKYTHRRDMLLLDFDGPPPALPLFWKRLRELKIHPTFVSYERSHTPGHWHATVGLPFNLHFLGHLFCNLYLGSDRMRERWGFLRWTVFKSRNRYVQVLFSKKIRAKMSP